MKQCHVIENLLFGVGAVSRLFENLRRAWKEGQSGMADKVEREAKNRRIAARRRRV